MKTTTINLGVDDYWWFWNCAVGSAVFGTTTEAKKLLEEFFSDFANTQRFFLRGYRLTSYLSAHMENGIGYVFLTKKSISGSRIKAKIVCDEGEHVDDLICCYCDGPRRSGLMLCSDCGKIFGNPTLSPADTLHTIMKEFFKNPTCKSCNDTVRSRIHALLLEMRTADRRQVIENLKKAKQTASCL